MWWLSWFKNRIQGGSSNSIITYPWEGRSIISQRTHRAAKPYECVVCGAVISKGQQYARTTYVMDRKLIEATACRLCEEDRDSAHVKAGVS
jgi:hypothetical protein